MKCIRSGENIACRKCLQKGIECVVPEYHIGRHKGAKNKRSGIEKAVHQIEEAIRKSKKSDPQSQLSVSKLEELLKSTQAVMPQQPNDAATSDLMPSVQLRESTPASNPMNMTSDDYQKYANNQYAGERFIRSSEPNNLSVNDAENPLQLLAQTSELLLTPQQSTPAATVSVSNMTEDSSVGGQPQPQVFFSRYQSRLDNEPQLDPVEMGLVTFSEADLLFTYFNQSLAHTRWGLDPVVYTTAFVRKRSNFLFTAVLAASCLFLPSTAAMSKRLSAHCHELALHVIKQRKRSAEIVLAFIICIPWMSFGEQWADDETPFYLSVALSMALDLSLNKIVTGVPSSLVDHSVPRADCIDARRALEMDGFLGVEATSIHGRRLLRRRERIWLALFVLERGVCLARGRNYTVPMSPLLERCDNWHISDIADPLDGNLISIAALRRALPALIDDIRRACDSHDIRGASSDEIVEQIHSNIENFFQSWFTTWPAQISAHQQLPPYVEILVSHTRLSTYSSVINHPSAPVNVKHFFRAAGLSAALNVMRAAVQGESRLKSMPNNTAIMISFAACFALRLSQNTTNEDSNFPLAPSVRNLINETADVLERIGSSPSHRKGASAIFAKQLRRIIHTRPISPGPGNLASANAGQTEVVLPQAQHSQLGLMEAQPALLPGRPIAFSGMSNNQIIETVNNAGFGFEDSWLDFSFDDSAGLDWLDWGS